MAKGYTSLEFIEFIDYLSNKGLLKKATARARKAAVVAFMEILEDSEKTDVRALNVDSLAMRFANIQGDNFTPQSLVTYKSRFNSAFKDFLSYRENPMGFSPSINQRGKRGKSSNNTTNSTQIKKDATTAQQSPKQKSETVNNNSEHTLTFPVPLRKGLIVQLSGIPVDLTTTEADRIADIVRALAVD